VHVLGIRSKTHVSEAALAAARRLLAVGCFCIGTNQVDLEVRRPPCVSDGGCHAVARGHMWLESGV